MQLAVHFYSLAYFDLPYNILVIIVVASRWVRLQTWKHDNSSYLVRDPESSVKSH